MAVNPETTVRKIVSLPRELADMVAAYQAEANLPSESEAYRQLIRSGLDEAIIGMVAVEAVRMLMRLKRHGGLSREDADDLDFILRHAEGLLPGLRGHIVGLFGCDPRKPEM